MQTLRRECFFGAGFRVSSCALLRLNGEMFSCAPAESRGEVELEAEDYGWKESGVRRRLLHWLLSSRDTGDAAEGLRETSAPQHVFSFGD